MIPADAIERAARAMEPGAFATFDAGYTNRNAWDERAFLNAEKTVKAARRKAAAAITVALSCPDGFRLVPVEPTAEMVRCGEDARYWAKSQAHEAYGADGYSLAPLRRRGGYEANVWVNA